MKKLITTIIVLLVLAAAVVGGYFYTRQPPVIDIATSALTRGAIIKTVGAVGTLEAVKTVKVGTQVTGIVSALYADFNHTVRKGQLLAQLDRTVLETQLAQQEANLARALADLERQKVQLQDAITKQKRIEELYERKIVSVQELEAAQLSAKSLQMQIQSSEAGITQSKAAVNTAETNLGYSDIYSPVDGVVINRAVDVGQTVVSSQSASLIFDIAEDLTKMQVRASVDESDVGMIRTGQTASFRVDAYPMQEFVGKVAQVRLQPVVQQNVVTYVTVIEVPNPEYKLKPGMTTNVTIEIARRENVLRVANGALRFRPTEETFTALNQEMPPELQRRQPAGGRTAGAGTRGGGAPGARGGQPAAAPASAEQQTATPGARQGRGEAAARAGGARGGAQADPDRQARMNERMQNMSPEERERMAQRLAGRGGGQSEAPAMQSLGDTIDALFGPLEFEETPGRLWLLVDGKLKAVPVRLGIDDGANTELIPDPSFPLQVGDEVVSAVNIGGVEAQRNTNRSPFMPGGMGRGRR